MITNIKAEILTIGDELLRGDIVNTNATWIATRCWDEGLVVEHITTVSDELSHIVAAVQTASHRCKALLVSGGLGPTEDDRTSAAIASAANKELVCDAQALAELEARFAQYARPFTDNNKKQAFFPEGATILPNRNGTAPGFSVKVNNCMVYCMPGVPSEMKQMFTDEIVPGLRLATGIAPCVRRTYKIFGLGESQIDDKLAGLLPSFESAGDLHGCQASLHYRTHFPENHVSIIVRADATGLADSLCQRISSSIQEKLGAYIFSEDGCSYSEAIVRALLARKETVATAESCTGGLISEMLTRVPGCSGAFHLGVTAYDNRFKQEVLNVPAELVERHGAVSQPVVEAMATGIRQLTGASYGLATSGILGPSGGSDEKPVGTAHFALATSEGVSHLERFFPYGRERTKTLSAYVALWLLRKKLVPAQDEADRWRPKRSG